MPGFLGCSMRSRSRLELALTSVVISAARLAVDCTITSLDEPAECVGCGAKQLDVDVVEEDFAI